MPGILIVYVPGLSRRGQSIERWKPLVELLKQEPELKDATWLPYDHRAHPTSRRCASDYAQELATKIHTCWETDGPFDSIILMGHSLGGVLVRKAFLMGAGADPAARLLQNAWAGAVRRIILFASINRGFDVNAKGLLKPIYKGILLNPGFRLARDLTRGSAFMTELRISWIRHFRHLGEKEPVVIQLLGARDSLVGNEDSADVEQFPRARQEMVDGATHGNVHVIAGPAGPARYRFLRKQILFTHGLEGSALVDKSVKDVVFLIHGIRASNSDWPAKARKLIEKFYPAAVPVPAGYPYFSALNFAVPFLRRKQIRWFQDQYSYCFAKYAEADIHYIGHSNGTYLLGHALRQIPSMRFARVTLAGSVLPQEFEWSNYLGKQVQEYRNHRAARDWPVGLLCSALHSLGMRDVGPGGFAGFLQTDARRSNEIFFYPGGHGAALESEEKLRSLIRYTLEGAEDYGQVPPVGDPRMASLAKLVSVGTVSFLLLIFLLLWPAVLMSLVYEVNGSPSLLVIASLETAYLLFLALVLKIL